MSLDCNTTGPKEILPAAVLHGLPDQLLLQQIATKHVMQGCLRTLTQACSYMTFQQDLF